MEENKKSVLFVAMSHQLTSEQIESAQRTLGVNSIVLLSDLNASLSEQMGQIPAQWGAHDIIGLAKQIVAEADKSLATHFCCLGQPSLFLWANLIASGRAHFINPAFGSYKLICVESTTERISTETKLNDGSVIKTSTFRHVQWRKIFE
jgi:hypothetical protein